MVQSKPVVTVLMATHNGSRFIAEAIASVRLQDYQDWQLVLVNDASTDTTREVVVVFNDARIRIIDNPEHLGLTKSLNAGLRYAVGEFIARIDDDDVWVSHDKLTRQVEFLRRHERVGLVGTQNRVIDESGRALYDWRVALTDSDIRSSLLARSHFVHSGVLIRRAALDEVGLYDESRHFAQDYELWLRLGRRWQLANLPNTWVQQRVNPHGVTSRHHLRQYLSFFLTAFAYRRSYPGFWRQMPVYGREFLLNLLPKPVFYRLSAWSRSGFPLWYRPPGRR